MIPTIKELLVQRENLTGGQARGPWTKKPRKEDGWIMILDKWLRDGWWDQRVDDRRSRTSNMALVSCHRFLGDHGQVHALCWGLCWTRPRQPQSWDGGIPRLGEGCHLNQHGKIRHLFFIISFFPWFGGGGGVLDILSCTLSLLIISLSLVFVHLWKQVLLRPATQLSS